MVYSWNGSAWTQRGSDINGEVAGNLSGESIAINDAGDVIIVGASNNTGANGSSSGHARVWAWNGSAWTQKGSDLDGEAAADGFGDSAAISGDGNTVAAGSMSNDPSGGVQNNGHVRVYNWNGSNWAQKGQDIDGSGNNDKIGANISMSNDGSIVAAGGQGVVRVYSYNGSSWTQRGSTLGISGQGNAIHRVSISGTGDVLAIGAGSNSTYVYKWNGSSWVQRASLTGSGNYGGAISLNNDGSILGVGSSGLNSNKGAVNIYAWNGSVYNLVDQTIEGEASGDLFGGYISLSNDGGTFAVGGIENDGGGNNSGHVRL